MGYYGKLSIFAYGDENIITQKILKRAESNAYSQEKNRQGLTRSCTTSPFGEYARKKRRDERMWCSSQEQKQETNFTSSFLAIVRSLNTNILLAQPENLPHSVDEASRPLLCNVSEVWIWKSLATGEKPIYRSGRLQDVGDASACSGSSQGVGDVKRVRLRVTRNRLCVVRSLNAH